MGVSTNAILCYGFTLDDEDENPDFPEELGKKLGVDSYEPDEWGEKWGVELVEHCSDGCPMWILADKDSVKEAWRGTPSDLGQELDGPLVRIDYQRILRRFCELSGIKYQEPQWLLCSWWA